jgi:hypothetical protein
MAGTVVATCCWCGRRWARYSSSRNGLMWAWLAGHPLYLAMSFFQQQETGR